MLQARSPSSFYGTLVLAYLGAMASSLIAQEGLKVLLLTVVSSQLFPDLKVLQQMPLREAFRVCVRGFINVCFAVLRVL